MSVNVYIVKQQKSLNIKKYYDKIMTASIKRPN